MVSTGLPRFAEQRALFGCAGAGADPLLGHPDVHASGPHQLVEPAAGQVHLADLDQVLGQVVLHDGQRLVLGIAEPPQVQDRRPGLDGQHRGGLVGGVDHLVGQHIGPRGLMMTGQVVEQAGQFDRPADLAVHHLGADTALADQQPLVDQFLYGATHRRAGQPELLGQTDLVVQAIARGQLTIVDRVLDLLGDLVVQRHWAGPVEVDSERGHRPSPVLVGPVVVHVSPT